MTFTPLLEKYRLSWFVHEIRKKFCSQIKACVFLWTRPTQKVAIAIPKMTKPSKYFGFVNLRAIMRIKSLLRLVEIIFLLFWFVVGIKLRCNSKLPYKNHKISELKIFFSYLTPINKSRVLTVDTWEILISSPIFVTIFCHQ